jgi:L-ascorbate peroxidase
MCQCLVGCYDTFRGYVNPPSIREPCCCCIQCGAKKDVHDVYYNSFLQSGDGGSSPDMSALENELRAFIRRMNCGPILIRLAWHDSGTYDQRIKDQFKAGGAIGTIIFDGEMSFGANAGLAKAKRYLDAFKQKFPQVSWADLIQMASALSVEVMGGPKIPMRYGRKDGTAADCAGTDSREGFKTHAGLPDAKPPFGCGAATPEAHLRNVFTKKMGFNDEEIVALSGAHTIGRTFATRSGTCPFAEGPGKGTSYTNKDGMGMAGGMSWTKQWLTFDNSYFKDWKAGDKELQWLPTDACLFTDPGFKVHAEKFAQDQEAFFSSYAQAHKKLSELGAVWA